MKIIYSCGDVNGIGVELFFKAVARFPKDEHILVINSKSLKEYYKKLKGKDLKNAGEDYFLDDEASFKIIDCPTYAEIKFGELKADSGELSAVAIKKSLEMLKINKEQLFVTLPINKASIALAGWEFQGHTEMIAKHYETDDFNMILMAGNLLMIPLTIHVPLKDVAEKITQDLIIRNTASLNKTLIEDFGVEKPRIAMLGLNPHAGDKSRIGLEEAEIIEPAVSKLKNDIFVDGPFAADSFFAFESYKNYDGIVAMYHDQGLIPIKMLANGGGVNFTSGLPIIRVSPDHGTAYSIAGEDQASERSLIEAIELGRKIYKNRQNNG